MIEITPESVQSFYSRVNKTEDCWLWEGYVNNRQCPVFRHNYQRMQAHRFAYMIANGIIDSTVEVKRSCGNKLCVNPHHLVIVSKEDNTDPIILSDAFKEVFQWVRSAIAQLKTLDLIQCNQLPKTQGIYFAYCEEKLVYVGSAKNFKSRFEGKEHHRLGSIKSQLRYRVLELPELKISEVRYLESCFIDHFNPVFNVS